MKKVWIVLILLTCFANVKAQHIFGIVHSNYTPTNSVYFNPSSILDAKTRIDINFIGLGSFTMNNLVYLKDQSGLNILNNSNLTEDDIHYRQGKRRYNVFNKTFVQGPGFTFSQGDHAFGLGLNVRSYTSVRKIPTFVGEFIQHGVQEYTPQHDIDYNIKNMRVGVVGFGEIDLSYAYTFKRYSHEMFMAGLTVKKILSVAGAGVNIYNMDLYVDNDSLINSASAHLDAMYGPEQQLYFKGGMGLDLGFTYQYMPRDASTYLPNSDKYGCQTLNYKYKIGVSIIDIGTVKYNPDAIRFAGYDFQQDSIAYTKLEPDEADFTSVFSDSESDITNGKVKKTDRIKLPTTFSFQFDYNLWASKLYVNASWVQGLPHRKSVFAVRHTSSLSVTPRYETKWFELAIPVSLYEYQHPQLGACLRLGPLTIGSDKMFSWFFLSDIYGADFYFHLKIPFFYNSKCKKKLKGARTYDVQMIKRRSNKCDAYN